MKDGAVLANAGHFDVEIDLPALSAPPTGRRATCCRSSRSTTLGGRRLNLLASGPGGQPRRRARGIPPR